MSIRFEAAKHAVVSLVGAVFLTAVLISASSASLPTAMLG